MLSSACRHCLVFITYFDVFLFVLRGVCRLLLRLRLLLAFQVFDFDFRVHSIMFVLCRLD